MGRYKFGEVDNERYYQIPKGLFTNPLYKDMGIDAKVIYAFLKDRMSLSNHNGWKDENGDIYLLFSQESIADILNCSVSTVSRAMRSLRQYDLIDVIRQGLNKPNKIYIRHIKTCTGDLSGHVTDANQDTSPVQTNETDINETEYSETENKRKGCVTSPKKSYAEFVTMTEEEYNLLLKKLNTDDAVQSCIEILDNYKGSKGKRYKSDYRAILSWVISEYEKRRSRQPRGDSIEDMAQQAQDILDRGGGIPWG